MKSISLAALALTLLAPHAPAQSDSPKTTPWTPEATPLPEYPRPLMQREAWTNLNGSWDYAITPADADAPPKRWDGQIRVPFCVESLLSGVQEPLRPDEALWYQRRFEAPDPAGGRLLLHFGAVDWRATVWVNGTEIGSHEGGYDPFTFDITDAARPGADNTLTVRVWDPTDTGTQPRGKQVLHPEGIWYTAVSGIWQTVWLEPVGPASFTSPGISADWAARTVRIEPEFAGDTDGLRYSAAITRPGTSVATAPTAASAPTTVHFDDPDAWSPDEPNLYEVVLTLSRRGEVVDEVKTYFAFREIRLGQDEQGVTRLFLNGEPLFMFGPLDQGWWPDGLYTAPTDEALRSDIERTRAFGFNMARKHVKAEPARWYYWADRLGLMVWQDMPSGDDYIGPGDPDITRTPESEATYRKEWAAIIDSLRHHPSIVAWVPFNEGWGQFKTNEIIGWTATLDPTRLVDGPSGWADRGGGNMHDAHMYPGPGMFPLEDERASVLGEFGGLGLPVEDHLWQQNDNWGYRTYGGQEELRKNYQNLVENLRPLIGRGLAAAVYTQTTDVEGEVNGLLTYDRRVDKMGAQWLAATNARAFGPMPVEHTLLPTSEGEKAAWRYTTDKPADGWEAVTFDDGGWKVGPGGFGTRGTPGAVIGTRWDTPDIWIRRTFTLDDLPDRGRVYLRMGHDEDAQVFINGRNVAEETGWTDGYRMIGPIDASALVRGKNTIAAHCSQTSGGQFIDIGIVSVEEPQ
jgi:hypothetical protein